MREGKTKGVGKVSVKSRGEGGVRRGVSVRDGAVVRVRACARAWARECVHDGASVRAYACVCARAYACVRAHACERVPFPT